jgi:predicted ABC-type ATPase
MEHAKAKAESANSREENPIVYVIAGPNGAGKSTFATEFLPEFANCREFLNAALIAAGLSPCAPETQNIRAGRLLLTRIKELTAVKQTFGFERPCPDAGMCASLRK